MTIMNSSSARVPLARPFDWTPIYLVSFCLSAHTYMLTNLFPYVGFMAAGFEGGAKDSAGFVAGYIASSFTFGRFLSSYFWGWVADRVGCKSVMIFSMISVSIGSLFFGVSQNFPWALTSRLLMGLTTGAMSSGRAIMPELAGKEHAVVAMSYVQAARGLGMIFGPALGGLLALPADHYPFLFSHTGLFGRFPYLLPNVVGAAMCLITVPLLVAILPESKHLADARPRNSKVADNAKSPQLYERVGSEAPENGVFDDGYDGVPGEVDEESTNRTTTASPEIVSLATPPVIGSGATSNSNGLNHDGQESVRTAPLLRGERGEEANAYGSINGSGAGGVQDDAIGQADAKNVPSGANGENGLLAIPHVPVLLLLSALMSAVGIGLDEAFPLWALSSHGVGGLEWSTIEIGQVLAIAGLGVTFVQLCGYSWLVKKIGMLKVQTGSSYLNLPIILTLPNVKYLSWNDASLKIALVLFLTIFWSCLSAINVGVLLASTSPVPPHLRGKLSGLLLMSQSLGRTIGPASWAAMYAWSISSSPTGGESMPLVDFRFVFTVSALIMGVVAMLSRRVLTMETMMNVVEASPPGKV